LNPIKNRGNFTIETGAHATRVIVEKGRVTGVEYIQNGKIKAVRVSGEVVVSAGSFDSPKLLMLSGIGPAAVLEQFGIAAVSDLPGVGQNLQDHLLHPVFYKSQKELPLPRFIAECGLFVRTRSGMQEASPDLQYHFSAGIPEFIPPDRPFTGANFAFVPILARPTSRGTVGIRSANPLDPPVIDPRYLSAEIDIAVLERGIELARELVNTRAFDELRGEEAAPGIGPNRQELREYIRTHCSTVWHVSGTCKMGRDEMAVVDPELRVRGVEGLRVADASIMPTIVSGNTHAACVMIAEKCAALMRGEEQSRAQGATN
jgi:choline dehydrogenase